VTTRAVLITLSDRQGHLHNNNKQNLRIIILDNIASLLKRIFVVLQLCAIDKTCSKYTRRLILQVEDITKQKKYFGKNNIKLSSKDKTNITSKELDNLHYST